MRLASSLLALLLAGPLFAAGRELAPPSDGLTPYHVGFATTASNGTSFFTAWDLYAAGGTRTVFGVMSDAKGATLSRPAFEIAPHTDTRWLAATTTADGDYALFWSTNERVEMLKITTLGTIRERRTLSGLPTSQAKPFSAEIARSGRQYFLLGYEQDQRIGYLLDENGGLVRGPIALPRLKSVFHGQLTATNDGFALTFHDSTGLYTHRVGRDGALGLRIFITPDAAGISWHATASDGANVIVVWTEIWEMKMAKIDADGHVKHFLIRKDFRYNEPPEAVFSAGGARYVVVTSEQLLSISDEGVLYSTLDVPSAYNRTLAASETHLLSAGNEYEVTSGSIAGGRIVTSSWHNRSLQPTMKDSISRTLTTHSHPAIVQVGASYAVAWASRALRSQAIETITLPAGRFAPGNVTQLGRTTTLAGIGRHAIATNGVDALVVWIEGETLYGQRVDSNGAALDERPFTIATGVLNPPVVVWTGAAYVVGWIDAMLSTVVVTPTGVPGARRRIPLTLPPGTGVSFNYGLDLAWNGSHLLGVFSRGQQMPLELPSTYFDKQKTFFLRLDAAGAPVDSNVLDLGRFARRASLASSGNEWIAVTDQGTTVTATIIAPNFTIGRSTPLFDWIDADFMSDVAWNGSEYAVATRSEYGGEHRLSMQWVDRAGHMTRTPRGIGIGPFDSITAPSVAGDMVVFSAFHSGSAPRATAVTTSDLLPIRAPDAPRNARLTRPIDAIAITWEDLSDNERGFLILQQTDGRWFVIATVGPNETRAKLKGNAVGPFRVRSWNEGGASTPAAVGERRRS